MRPRFNASGFRFGGECFGVHFQQLNRSLLDAYAVLDELRHYPAHPCRVPSGGEMPNRFQALSRDLEETRTAREA